MWRFLTTFVRLLLAEGQYRARELRRIQPYIADFQRRTLWMLFWMAVIPITVFVYGVIAQERWIISVAFLLATISWGAVLYATSLLIELAALTVSGVVKAVVGFFDAIMWLPRKIFKVEEKPSDTVRQTTQEARQSIGRRFAEGVTMFLFWVMVICMYSIIVPVWIYPKAIPIAAAMSIFLALVVYALEWKTRIFKKILFWIVTAALVLVTASLFLMAYLPETAKLLQGSALSSIDESIKNAFMWMAHPSMGVNLGISSPWVAIGGLLLIFFVGRSIYRSMHAEKVKLGYRMGFATGWVLLMIFMLSQVGQTLPTAQGRLPSLPSLPWGENTGVQIFEGLTPDEKFADRYEVALDPGVYLGDVRKGWNPAYTQVFRGDIIVFLCEGTYQWDPKVKDMPTVGCGGATWRPEQLVMGRPEEFPLPDKPIAAVVGRLGEGFEPFLIGRGGAYEVKARCGIIDLAINDRQSPEAYTDNVGTAAVSILVFRPKGQEGLVQPEC